MQYFSPNTSDGLLEWMKAEFNKQYTGNRAPVGLYTHAAWFNVNEARFDAYKRFLDYLGTLKDVFIVSTYINKNSMLTFVYFLTHYLHCR